MVPPHTEKVVQKAINRKSSHTNSTIMKDIINRIDSKKGIMNINPGTLNTKTTNIIMVAHTALNIQTTWRIIKIISLRKNQHHLMLKVGETHKNPHHRCQNQSILMTNNTITSIKITKIKGIIKIETTNRETITSSTLRINNNIEIITIGTKINKEIIISIITIISTKEKVTLSITTMVIAINMDSKKVITTIIEKTSLAPSTMRKKNMKVDLKTANLTLKMQTHRQKLSIQRGNNNSKKWHPYRSSSVRRAKSSEK